MDTTSKFFIFMIVLAVIIGAFVVRFKPQHNLATVYKSNARYYPHINDETVLKKIQKPPAAEEGVTTFTGTHKPTIKKMDTHEFVPD
ncbi:MAG: hypothetical protein CVU80_02075 [Elusimicrobia bacterium HGW-Elusimicrobia-4]|nr:MAG: hypothetical protein CVU80_02075 [Elusimicrobia bacterium HGW-Elusimicrobia-4]